MQRQRDPRIYQIATLAALVAYGVSGLDLEIQLVVAAVIVASPTRRSMRRTEGHSKNVWVSSQQEKVVA